MKIKDILGKLISSADSGKETHKGFSTTPRSIGNEYSWQKPQPEPPRPPVNTEKMKRLEREAIISTGGTPTSTGGYPSSGIQRRTADNATFWKPADGGTPGGRKPSGGGDLGNYGFPLPRYTAPQQAANAYTSGDKFDPAQTLFRYDPQTLNVLAEEKFRRDPANTGKSFIKPYDEKNPVYEGFPDRHGARGFGRAWDHTANDGRGNERGGYLFDLREHDAALKRQIEERLSKGHAVALREHYSIPAEPTRTSKASIDPWSGSPDPKRKITASRAIGGGEQIIGNHNYFKFNKP